MKRSTQRIASLALTALVITFLLLASPAQAVSLNIANLPATAQANSQVNFQASLTLDSQERLPLTHFTLFIEGPDGIECEFTPNGQPINGCEDLMITPTSVPHFGQGWLFGYGYGYGYLNQPVHAADLNGDGVVDKDDLLLLLENWGPCDGYCPADLNGDGVVNVSDLLILLGGWTYPIPDEAPTTPGSSLVADAKSAIADDINSISIQALSEEITALQASPAIISAPDYDLNNDGVVNHLDMMHLMMQMGPCDGSCPADFNNDGVVNIVDVWMLANAINSQVDYAFPAQGPYNTVDLEYLLDNWGECGDVCPADLNQDGTVNVSDLLILLGDWDHGTPVEIAAMMIATSDVFINNDFATVPFGFGYGYGYSYGYGTPANQFVFDVTWNTPDVTENTTYAVSLHAHASNNAQSFTYKTQQPSMITIVPEAEEPGQPGPGPGTGTGTTTTTSGSSGGFSTFNTGTTGTGGATTEEEVVEESGEGTQTGEQFGDAVADEQQVEATEEEIQTIQAPGLGGFIIGNVGTIIGILLGLAVIGAVVYYGFRRRK